MKKLKEDNSSKDEPICEYCKRVILEGSEKLTLSEHTHLHYKCHDRYLKQLTSEMILCAR